jgi:sugar O-acyltransferase (sialic acid O-acetyltransferase NeuD family)
MKDIVIIGAGGFGKEVLWIIEEINKTSPTWNFLGFIDDNLPIGQSIVNYSIIGNLSWFKSKKIHAVCAVGDPLFRKKIIFNLSNYNIVYPILVHPSVIIAPSSLVGEGSIICPGSIVSVDTRISNHVIINYGCTIGHDVTIDDYSSIFPGANIAGNVHIKKCVTIGTGAKIIQQLCVGENTIIGAGAVVTKNIERNVVAVGIPAKPIKTRDLID